MASGRHTERDTSTATRKDSGLSSQWNAAYLESLLETMHQAADAARAITLGAFRAPLTIDNKASGARLDGNTGAAFDPVTNADRETEACLRDRLSSAHPEIGFIGEESSSGARGQEPSVDAQSLQAHWVVDPIDGTRAFMSGIPLWGTLIALNVGGRVPLGLLDQPVLGERYVARPGKSSAYFGGSERRLATRQGVALASATLSCTSTEMFAAGGERDAFDRVAGRARLVRYGGDCYAFAQLAAGHIDVVVEADLAPWDIQALVPLVREAGGELTTWSGGDPAHGGQIVAAGSAALHAEVLELLTGGHGG